jgi:hypothetical protein
MRYGSARSREALAGGEPRAGPPRRHWWRWILAGALTRVVPAVAATGAVVKLAPEPARRVLETIIGFSNDVTGRTGNVRGTGTVHQIACRLRALSALSRARGN